MYEKIKYDKPFGFDTFRHMIVADLGEDFWNELADGIELPDMRTESTIGCANMRRFMYKFESMAGDAAAKRVLKQVRHGLHPSQAEWAKTDFEKFGDLDKYIEFSIAEGLENFRRLYENGEDFYGQPVTPAVLDYLKDHTECLSARRDGNKLYFMAFPAYMDAYIHETDEKKKRYHACHCPFARESILTDKPVSATLCYCSFGHVVNCWEAIFERELHGKAVSSVLNGDMNCEYMVTIPDDIMKKYVKEK